MAFSNRAKTVVSALLASASVSTAANIIQDDFSTNPSNPNTVGWYTASGGFSTFSGTSGGLQFTSSSTGTNQSVFKQFTPTTLAVGEIMTLSMKVTAMSEVPDTSSIWRIGLFDTASTFTANQTTTTPWSTADEGYILALSTNLVEGGGAKQNNIYHRTGSTNIVTTGGTPAATSISNLNDRLPVSGALPLTMSLSVERLSETQVRVSAFWLENGVLGGTMPSVTLDSTAPTYVDTFDTIYFGYGAGADGRTFTIDDVTLSIVPEPSHALLSLCGLGMLAIRRRR